MERKSQNNTQLSFWGEVTKFACEDFISISFTAESLSCSETQPSNWSLYTKFMKFIYEVNIRFWALRSKKLRFEKKIVYAVRNGSYWHYRLPYVDVYFKRLLEDALRFETDVVLNILPCAQRNLRGRTHDAVRVTRMSFKPTVTFL